MTLRQPKLPLALRIIAAGCVVVWLAGVSACNLEAFFGCDSHGDAAAAHNHGEHSHDMAAADTTAHPAPDTDAHRSDDTETHHAPDAEGDSHEHNGKEDSCCSTLNAVVQTAKSFDFSKPTFQPITFVCVLLETHAATLALSENPPNRQAKPRDWVFTPEVCTGLANRSHAPPAFV